MRKRGETCISKGYRTANFLSCFVLSIVLILSPFLPVPSLAGREGECGKEEREERREGDGS